MTALYLSALSALAATVAIAAPYDITTPDDSIRSVTRPGWGDNVVSPGNERVEHAIDNQTDKYLNFSMAGSGLIVNPASTEAVTGLRLYTADDSIDRDPASYTFEGSSDGLTWTMIASGGLDLPSGRNASGQALDPEVQFNQLVAFSNSVAYDQYRVIFPTLRDEAAANSMQIGEVELLTSVPEPSSLGILLVGGILAIRRQRHA